MQQCIQPGQGRIRGDVGVEQREEHKQQDGHSKRRPPPPLDETIELLGNVSIAMNKPMKTHNQHHRLYMRYGQKLQHECREYEAKGHCYPNNEVHNPSDRPETKDRRAVDRSSKAPKASPFGFGEFMEFLLRLEERRQGPRPKGETDDGVRVDSRHRNHRDRRLLRRSSWFEFGQPSTAERK